MIRDVVLQPDAVRSLKKAPVFIVNKMHKWVKDVQVFGLEEVRKIPGWHDHPLKGERKGQRSIYLNKQWRAIYILDKKGIIEFASVEEVSLHKY